MTIIFIIIIIITIIIIIIIIIIDREIGMAINGLVTVTHQYTCTKGT